MYRQLVLTNKINKIVYLREAQEAAAEGHYGHETGLGPNSVKSVRATEYQDRNRYSSRSSEIVIFVGEDKALRSLTPENFIQYVELIFEMNEDTKTLTVSGVPAEGLADDFLRLGGLPRRDYSHRKRVIVLSCGFKADEVKNKSQTGTSAGDAADRAKDYAHKAEGRGKGVATTVVDKTKEAAGNVADTTKGVAHGAKENTEKVVDGAADAAQSVGDRAKQTAEKIKETVVGKADEAQSRR